MRGQILVVDDELDASRVLAQILRQHGFGAEAVGSGQACLERLSNSAADIVVTDVVMPEMNGIELCARVREHHPDVLPIVMTGMCAPDLAIAAIRAGAFDYIVKPITVPSLEHAVVRALDQRSLQHELERLHAMTERELTGACMALGPTLDLARRIADSDATVLITGESGSGKEVVARALHRFSDRRDEPFIAINCSAMPAALLESELFGHVRGAFTDAVRARPGLLLQAGGGTILLDEIGDMPLDMQAKLLRVLQDRRVRPVGGDDEVTMRARVIAATNRQLEVDVARKRFREDLYYRINVVAIPVPPLRERRADILPLASFMLRQAATRSGKPVDGLTHAAARLLLDYDWPGNVRELENCIERAVALCRLDRITADDLPDRVRRADSRFAIAGDPLDELVTLDEVRSRYIRRVLAMSNGNKSLAARILGIDRRTVAHCDRRPNAPLAYTG